MADGDSPSIGLGEAATRFLSKLPAKDKKVSQQEVHKFVRWYGWERPLAGLTAHEIASYAEQLSLSDTEYTRKLELIRDFLVYAKKEGWSKINLALHLKTRKAKTGSQSSVKQGLPETIPLTEQGYAEIQTELTTLKSKRHQLIDDMRRAAADKDFRENAPLHAAREQRGHVEGRIKELEETLKIAKIISSQQKATPKANIGNSVTLHDPTSGQELHYTIVNPKEVDPTKGKISSASPIGRAVIDKEQGETVEIAAPVGKLRYQIKLVEH